MSLYRMISILILLSLIEVIPKWSSGFPHFLQFNSEFRNKDFMI